MNLKGNDKNENQKNSKEDNNNNNLNSKGNDKNDNLQNKDDNNNSLKQKKTMQIINKSQNLLKMITIK